MTAMDAVNNRKDFMSYDVENLDKKYQIISALGIGDNLPLIRHLYVFSSYWYFLFMDSAGNPIEIIGEYRE